MFVTSFTRQTAADKIDKAGAGFSSHRRNHESCQMTYPESARPGSAQRTWSVLVGDPGQIAPAASCVSVLTRLGRPPILSATAARTSRTGQAAFANSAESAG